MVPSSAEFARQRAAKQAAAKAKKAKATPGQTGKPGNNSSDPLEKLYGSDAMKAAEELRQKFAAPGSLGSINGGPSEMQQDYTNQLKAGLEGYTSPEYQAQREQMMQGVNSQYATAQDQLARAQARGKVYGAAGAAQQANLSTGLMNSKNDLEQKLMVQNIDEKQKRLGAYGANANALQAQDVDAQKTNMGNRAAEATAGLNAYTGIGGMAMTQQGNAQMQNIMKRALAAQGK